MQLGGEGLRLRNDTWSPGWGGGGGGGVGWVTGFVSDSIWLGGARCLWRSEVNVRTPAILLFEINF